MNFAFGLLAPKPELLKASKFPLTISLDSWTSGIAWTEAWVEDDTGFAVVLGLLLVVAGLAFLTGVGVVVPKIFSPKRVLSKFAPKPNLGVGVVVILGLGLVVVDIFGVVLIVSVVVVLGVVLVVVVLGVVLVVVVLGVVLVVVELGVVLETVVVLGTVVVVVVLSWIKIGLKFELIFSTEFGVAICIWLAAMPFRSVFQGFTITELVDVAGFQVNGVVLSVAGFGKRSITIGPDSEFGLASINEFGRVFDAWIDFGDLVGPDFPRASDNIWKISVFFSN